MSKNKSQSQSGMGGGSQGQMGMRGGAQGQAGAANGVQAQGSSTPSMGQMQEGMGGLLTLQGMMDGFQDYISPMVNTVRGIQDDGNQFMMNLFDSNPAKKAFEEATGVEPTSQGDVARETIAQQVADRTPDPVVEPTPTTPELSPYEKRIQELMTVNGMTRQQAEENQAHAQKLRTDGNSDGAVTNKEWALSQGGDLDGDGDVTAAEWNSHKAGSKTVLDKFRKKKKKPEDEVEDFGLQEDDDDPQYSSKAARAARAAKLARIGWTG